VIRFLPIVIGLALLLAGPAAPQDPPIPADTEVKTTASGLKYSVLKAGDPKGVHPQMGDSVTVHYTGWLEDGKVFDSSRKRGQPATFKLGQVIQGWNEGLQLMTPGARFKFTIPANLAYGADARGAIPANATLIFDVELLSVKAGLRPPKFKPGNPEAQKTTKSGLKYEALKEGKGPGPEKTDGFELKFALWTEDGKLVDCTEYQNGQTLKGNAAKMGLEFLKEAPFLMKPGARYRFEVPAKLCWKDQKRGPIEANALTVWELELVQVYKPLPMPAFSASPEDKIKKTKSGLKYEIIREGTGPSPKMGSMVTVHYAGWLPDGTPFDDSFSTGIPAELQLGRVIQGWNEGLQLMKTGAVYKFTIPSYLAYGTGGAPPKIGPNQALVFHVELIKVAK